MTSWKIRFLVRSFLSQKIFYKEILGCKEGRSSDNWVDFDLFGHQLVIHYQKENNKNLHTNPVDGKDVPVPHFGVVLEWGMFKRFSLKLEISAWCRKSSPRGFPVYIQ